MSNAIRYDSLLVHYLARELRERLVARRLKGVRLDPEHRRLVLELDDERLVWELHPARGWLRVVKGAVEAGAGLNARPGRGGAGDRDAGPGAAVEGWGGRKVPTQRRPRVRDVVAPPDERWLEIQIDAGGADRASRLLVELMTNQWNVLALAPDRRIVAALWPRDAGKRRLRPGQPYEPPAGAEAREGAESPVPLERWRELLGGIEPGERARTLVRHVAWTSPLNVPSLLGAAAGTRGGEDPVEDAPEEGGADERADDEPAADVDADALDRAWERYRWAAARPDPQPQLLELGRPTPYPLPLPGVPGRPALSLLAALEMAAAEEAPGGLAPEVRDALEERLARVTRRAERLRAEAESAPERAAELRGRADVLMARLQEVEKGETEVALDDFEGGRITLSLDPALTPAENAQALYDRARKRARAAERLPARVREALGEQNRLESLLDALDRGDADPADVARWVEEVRPDDDGGGADGEARLPYHRFRSSGGLEIRVGRSGKANDALTFHHSAPDDIWLHARDVAGAHVILRWPARDQNPPKRDLLEAAILAALNSRARTSTTVPVDWTRRKYVRKPRKAPPGAVLPDRVQTVFVEPDERLVERLRGE